MTVNDFEMARGRRVGQDDASERWKDLADLRDGRREKWMTDRAKHALGTPKWVEEAVLLVAPSESHTLTVFVGRFVDRVILE